MARPHLTPAPAPIRRFSEVFARLWPERTGRLGLAVSGGPDSTALLLIAAAALPGEVDAASVDHGLRGSSAEECETVACLCAELGVPHEVLRVTVAAGNLQAQARRARYQALAGWIEERGLAALATAHHADDQAETLLLRLNRASGVAGLAGTRARGLVPGTSIPLLRPLLGWRRTELAAIVEAAGIAAAQDPANADDRFDRARMRKAIAASDWLDVAAIAETAGHLADADAAIDWAARREWHEQVREEGLGITYRPQAPRAVALRVIARIVARLDGEEARGGAIARLFDALAAGQPASVGALVVRPGHSGWSFAKSPRRASKSG
ncbi:MAG: tRNA lysidine(34) synthetase TilS [Novosphingobium sp.]